MRRPMRWLALFAAAGVVACGEKAADSPTAPEFKPSSTGCSFTTIQQAVNAVFDGSTDTDVSALVTDAKNLKGDDPPAADLKLYEVLDSLAYHYAQGSVDDAAKLGYQTLLCTIGGATGLTEDTFEPAFGTSGAFASLAYEPNDTRVVGSHDGLWVLHPPAGKSWNDIAKSPPPPADPITPTPLIIYGAPVPPEDLTGDFTADPPIESTTIFNWESHPDGVIFSPKVVVGNCEPGTGPEALYIQHNSVTDEDINSGEAEILDFVAPTCTSDFSPQLRLGLGERIWRLFAPTTLHASFFLPTSGGQKGALSPDAAVTVDALVFSFKSQPHKTLNKVGVPLVAKDGDELTVIATSDGGTNFNQSTVFGWLEATSNKGSFVEICHNWVYSDENGEFHFVDAVLNKAGGYTLTFKSPGTDEGTSAEGAPGVDPIVQPVSDLFNVKNGTATECPAGSSYPGTGTFPPIPEP